MSIWHCKEDFEKKIQYFFVEIAISKSFDIDIKACNQRWKMLKIQ